MKFFLMVTAITALICAVLFNVGPGAVFIPGIILAYACFSIT